MAWIDDAFHWINWDFIAAIGTVGIAAVGWIQITAARRQARGWRTLDACEKYDTDPVLDLCSQNLAAGKDSGDFDKAPRSYRLNVYTLLNYLEGLSIGIDQNLYVEDIVRDHLEGVVRKLVGDYLDEETAKKIGFDPRDYERLAALDRRWSATQTHFRDRWQPWKLGRK